jgi:hypothetical protein
VRTEESKQMTPVCERDDLAVLMMDHLAPRSGRDLRTWEGVDRVHVDVVSARSV